MACSESKKGDYFLQNSRKSKKMQETDSCLREREKEKESVSLRDI